MGKSSTRVYELAKTLGMTGKELVTVINGLKLNFTVQNHMGTLSEEQVAAIKGGLERQKEVKSTTAIDAKSQSTATSAPSGVRIRRRPMTESSENETAEAKNTKRSGVDMRQPAVAKSQSRPSVPKTPEKSPASQPTPETRRAPATTEKKSTPTDAPKPAETAKEATPVRKAEPQEIQPTAQDAKKQPEVKAQEKVFENTAMTKTENIIEKSIVEKNASDGTEAKTVASKHKETDHGNKRSKQKSELIIIAPKFGEDNVGDFVDSIPTEFADAEGVEETVIEEEEEELEILRINAKAQKRSSKPKKKGMDGEEKETGSEDTFAEKKKKQPVGASNIVGFIDPATLKSRLDKDRKTFSKKQESHVQPAGYKEYVPHHEGGSSSYGAPKRPQQKKDRKSNVPDRTAITHAAEHKRVVRISDSITVSALAQEMGVKAAEIIKLLKDNFGEMMTINQSMDIDTASIVAEAFNFTVQDISFKEETFVPSDADKPEDLVLRPPVVTVMGHVDHGKTSLLDAIRSSSVRTSEAGGITQHIGASTIDTGDGIVVFLDTPGHEAFTTLRARGAKVTDLVVLVVAADDGVMPQTVEAINHAKAADVPLIVAVNKIDKPGANPDRVKQALTEFQLVPEEWGGTTIFAEVSALTGKNIPELLELIELQSEVLELKANPKKEARGIVLESYKDPRHGTIATLIIQDGTLNKGDIVVTGATYGKVKTMTNDHGRRVKDAGPSMPVSITGLNEVPEAGEQFFVVKNEKLAREYTDEIKNRKRMAELNSKKFDPWAAFKESKVLNVIVKADVQGSVEALQQSLVGLSTEEVELRVVHSAIGAATESDVQLAIASNALIVCFNTRPEARATEIAKRESISIECYSVIYDVIDKMKEAMSGLLDPVLEENVTGHAEVRNTFNVPKVGTIAGCYVTSGKITRNSKARLLRNGKIIYESTIGSLKRFKDDAKEVRSGFECGLSIDNYNDVKVGDIVETYEIIELKASI